MDIALARLQAGSHKAAVSAAELKPVVAELRRQRAGMVQTAEQYCFCYQARRPGSTQLPQQQRYTLAMEWLQLPCACVGWKGTITMRMYGTVKSLATHRFSVCQGSVQYEDVP